MILQERKHHNFKKGIFIVAFLFLAVANFLVFWLYINIDTIRMTFTDYQWGEYVFVGFDNYARQLENIFLGKNVADQTAFWNGFHAIAINLIILPISIVVAYAFYKKVPGTTFFRVVFYLPSIISLVILATAFRNMFTQDYEHGVFGPVAQILSWMGINPPSGSSWLNFERGSQTFWPLVYTFCILNGMSTNVILISSAMQRIPAEVSEASKIDGCGFFHELFHVTLPLVMPTIITWIMLIFTSVMGFYLQPMLIANGTASSEFYTSAWVIFSIQSSAPSKSNLISAATLGIIVSLFILPINLLLRALLSKHTAEVSY